MTTNREAERIRKLLIKTRGWKLAANLAGANGDAQSLIEAQREFCEMMAEPPLIDTQIETCWLYFHMGWMRREITYREKYQ